MPFGARSNPIPWINAWLVSDNVQVAPQEVEVSSYLVGQIDSKVDTNDLGIRSLIKTHQKITALWNILLNI